MKSIKVFKLTFLAIFLAVGAAPAGAYTYKELKEAIARLPEPTTPPPKAYITIKHQGLDLTPEDKIINFPGSRWAHSKPFTLNIGPWYQFDYRKRPQLWFRSFRPIAHVTAVGSGPDKIHPQEQILLSLQYSHDGGRTWRRFVSEWNGLKFFIEFQSKPTLWRIEALYHRDKTYLWKYNFEIKCDIGSSVASLKLKGVIHPHKSKVILQISQRAQQIVGNQEPAGQDNGKYNWGFVWSDWFNIKCSKPGPSSTGVGLPPYRNEVRVEFHEKNHRPMVPGKSYNLWGVEFYQKKAGTWVRQLGGVYSNVCKCQIRKYQNGGTYVKHQWRCIALAKTNQTARVRFKVPSPPPGQEKQYDINVAAGWEEGDYGAVTNSVTVVVQGANVVPPSIKVSSKVTQMTLRLTGNPGDSRKYGESRGKGGGGVKGYNTNVGLEVAYSQPFILDYIMPDRVPKKSFPVAYTIVNRWSESPDSPEENRAWRNAVRNGFWVFLLISTDQGKTWKYTNQIPWHSPPFPPYNGRIMHNSGDWSLNPTKSGAGSYLAKLKVTRWRDMPMKTQYPFQIKYNLKARSFGQPWLWLRDKHTIEITVHEPTTAQASRELRSAGQGNLPAKPGNIIPYNIAALQADMRRAQKVLKEINNKPKQDSPTLKKVNSVKVGDIRRARLELRKGNRLLLGN